MLRDHRIQFRGSEFPIVLARIGRVLSLHQGQVERCIPGNKIAGLQGFVVSCAVIEPAAACSFIRRRRTVFGFADIVVEVVDSLESVAVCLQGFGDEEGFEAVKEGRRVVWH